MTLTNGSGQVIDHQRRIQRKRPVSPLGNRQIGRKPFGLLRHVLRLRNCVGMFSAQRFQLLMHRNKLGPSRKGVPWLLVDRADHLHLAGASLAFR